MAHRVVHVLGHSRKHFLLSIMTAVMMTLAGSGCGSQKVRSVIELIRSIQPSDTTIAVDWAQVVGNGPQFYGVEYGWIDQDRNLYLERYRRLHVNVVRVQISQEFFEPVNDNDDAAVSTISFSQTLTVDAQQGKTMTYEDMFESLAAAFPEMYFQINIWLAARWNASNPNGYFGLGGAFPPRDYAEHREFVQALARWLVDTCGIKPEHLSFTFVNEPNLTGFFVGAQADLVRMASETRAALDEVSPLIQMGGLDEVHGTAWTDAFFPQRPARCCDLWAFHAYERGIPAMLNALLGRTEHLKPYGPVWVTEFADTANGSPDGKMDFSTRTAALGFAEILGRLWGSGIDGILHFQLSDTYADIFGGWVGHGLFADARGTHANGQAYAPFPSYWVFANMYRELGGSQVVSVTAPSELAVVAARRGSGDSARLAVWVTNSTAANYNVQFQVTHFPTETVNVQVLDNLVGDTPIEIRAVSGPVLTLSLSIPAQSSRLVVFTPTSSPHMVYLPLVLS